MERNFDDLQRGDDLKEVLDYFSGMSGVVPVVVGTIGFELHGALPSDYLIGDIDLFLFADKASYNELYSMLYEKYVEYRKEIKDTRDLAGMSLKHRCFIFKTNSGMKANVWLKPLSEIQDYDICTLFISNRFVKTLSLRAAMDHKISIKRLKDLEFIVKFIRQFTKI